MNVARKSTTKITQKWQQDQKLESREEEIENGVNLTDSTDSFQDALLNLKALSGSGEMAETDRSEVKEAQSSSSGLKQIQNGDSDHGTSVSKGSTEDEDILEQFDDIVNEAPVGAKSDQGSEDDDILIVKDDDCQITAYESNGKADSCSKNTAQKNPLLKGEMVRRSLNNIVSKLVQSNPDASDLYSNDSRRASYDKRNLFDNFDLSERDNSTPLTSDNGNKYEQPRSEIEEGTRKVLAHKMGPAGDCGEMHWVEEKVSVVNNTSPREPPMMDGSGDCMVPTTVDRSGDCSSRFDNNSSESDVEIVSSAQAESLKPDSSETTVQKKLDLVKPVDKMPKIKFDLVKQMDKLSKSGSAPCFDKKDGDLIACLETKTSIKIEHVKRSLSSRTARACDSKKEITDDKPDAMDTTCIGSSNRVTCKASEKCVAVSVSKPEIDRKRPIKDKSDDDESVLPPKRSRLDEVIGKLGERVTFPASVAAIDDFEDSTLGDTDSPEKQSEEISASTSDDDESNKTKIFHLSRPELKQLMVNFAKRAIEQHQSTEVLALNRRVEELLGSQEEWKTKAKGLERQVLDLTVLQQRLEKRKAHAAALKSITTRSIGIWVTEDKFKSYTPQKIPPPPRIPTATTAVVTQGTPVWVQGQPAVRSLVSSDASSLPGTNVVSVTVASAVSRNTSVAHLLSQTARMPTVASCVAANQRIVGSTTGGKTMTTGPRMVGPPATLVSNLGSSTIPTSAPARGLVPSAVSVTSNVVLVSSNPSQAVASRAVLAQQQVAAAATVVTTPAIAGQNKVIDLTMEDDPAAIKQVSKVVAPSGVRVSQQLVRQMTPVSQPAVPSSAILFTSPPGAQIVNATNIQRPGMLQMVTIANAQSLRPGSIFTVVPGQAGSVVRPPGTAVTNSREGPLVVTQPITGGMTLMRPPTNAANLRPMLTPAGTNNGLTTGRASVALTTAQPSAATASGPVQLDKAAHPPVNAPPKRIHPAPLPDRVCPKGLPANLKLPPPCPGLKISRVKQGIVLSWNMSVPADCAEISSYQLYAYQETSAPPETSLWKKVGDVKALPLPMACTLTQFQDGNKYHFAVRAIDHHGRSGPFSEPSYIFLSKAA